MPPNSTTKQSLQKLQQSQPTSSSHGARASNQNNSTESSINDDRKEAGIHSSNILEKARAAITSAERASAAARAAAQLENVNFGSLKLEGKS